MIKTDREFTEWWAKKMLTDRAYWEFVMDYVKKNKSLPFSEIPYYFEME